MSFAGAWGPPNLGDGVSGRQDGGQIQDSRRGQVEFRSGRILTEESHYYGTQAPVSLENGVLVGQSQVWKLLSRGRIRSAM
jgi:hypothetical protein